MSREEVADLITGPKADRSKMMESGYNPDMVEGLGDTLRSYKESPDSDRQDAAELAEVAGKPLTGLLSDYKPGNRDGAPQRRHSELGDIRRGRQFPVPRDGGSPR